MGWEQAPRQMEEGRDLGRQGRYQDRFGLIGLDNT